MSAFKETKPAANLNAAQTRSKIRCSELWIKASHNLSIRTVSWSMCGGKSTCPKSKAKRSKRHGCAASDSKLRVPDVSSPGVIVVTCWSCYHLFGEQFNSRLAPPALLKESQAGQLQCKNVHNTMTITMCDLHKRTGYNLFCTQSITQSSVRLA